MTEFGKVIVTGGSGFLGSHLVDALVPLSQAVHVIDRVAPRKLQKNASAKYHLVDMREEAVTGVIASVKPDVVFHLAAHIHDRESMREPIMNAENNIIGSLRVFEAVKDVPEARIVFASSGVVYGNQDMLPIPETATPMPRTPYAITQLTCEQYLHVYKEVHGMPFVILRLANVYGPRQDESAESGAIGISAARFLTGKQVFINNDGETTRDYVYVSDAVDALLRAAKQAPSGEVYNVGTGEEVSTKDVIRKVRETVGVLADADFRERVEDVVRRLVLDNEKIRRDLSWQPTVLLAQGIEKTVEWYRENA